MSGESTALENLWTRIGDYLRETIGRYEVTRDGSYSPWHGTTRLIIKPSSLPDTDKTSGIHTPSSPST